MYLSSDAREESFTTGVSAHRDRAARRATLVLTLLIASVALGVTSCAGSNPGQPTATTVPVRLTVQVVSLDAFGAAPSDFQVSAGGNPTPGSGDGTIVMLPAHTPFRVTTAASTRPEGYAETMSGFCSGDSGAPAAVGSARTCLISETEQPLACDQNLWRRTYAPWRFRQYTPCQMGSGTIEEVWQSEDGDLDMTVRANGTPGLAPGQTLLMVEVPCQFSTTWQIARDACGNSFQNSLHLAAGMRVRVAGPRVGDWNHTPQNPQTEIHGAVIRVLGGPPDAVQTQAFRPIALHPEGYLGGGRYEEEEEPASR